MGVNDWGQPADGLDEPELSAWAESVAAVVNNSDVPVDTRVAAKVSKAGDTMTGRLLNNHSVAIGDGWSGATIAPAGQNSLKLLDWDLVNPATITVDTPTVAGHAATKQYVDAVGKWTDYTPEVVNMTGTANGSYSRIGDTVNLILTMTLNDVLTHASPTMKLPPAAPAHGMGALNTAMGLATVGGLPYVFMADIFNSTDVRFRYALQYSTDKVIHQSFNNWSGGVPSGSSFRVALTYRALPA